MCIMRADSILTVLKILFAFKIETHWANAIIMFLHFILLLAAFCFILLSMCKKKYRQNCIHFAYWSNKICAHIYWLVLTNSNPVIEDKKKTLTKLFSSFHSYTTVFIYNATNIFSIAINKFDITNTQAAAKHHICTIFPYFDSAHSVYRTVLQCWIHVTCVLSDCWNFVFSWQLLLLHVQIEFNSSAQHNGNSSTFRTNTLFPFQYSFTRI